MVLGNDRQLEFSRSNQYLPVWITPRGRFVVDDFFPERNLDFNLDYNYVRLLEEGPGKIVVHWRYFPDFSVVKHATDILEPTALEGITSVVHKVFTIYPDGKVDREVKDARGSDYESWIRPGFAHRQTMQLSDSGITYSPVIWGRRQASHVESDAKSPVRDNTMKEKPVREWTFDEAGYGLPDGVDDEELWDVSHVVVEWNSRKLCPILGGTAVFKEGVSGTSMGFDGYYTGVSWKEEDAVINKDMSIEAWLALDVYPFNEAPIIHQSKDFGTNGFYLGISPYGKFFLRVNGKMIESKGVNYLGETYHRPSPFMATRPSIKPSFPLTHR